MDNTEFMDMYDNYLAHKWVSSRDSAKAAAQKKAEQDYNKKYYQEHKQEILDKRRQQQGVNDLRRYHRNFTKEEALADLNSRQTNSKTAMQTKAFGGGMSDTVYQNRVKMYRAQGMSEAEAKKKVNSERLAAIGEQMSVDRRNANAKRTGLAQGEQQKASVEYNARQKRINTRNTNASNAQADAARSKNAAKRKKRAPAAQATNQKSSALSKRINSDNAKTSRAQSDAARKNAAYQQSFTGKLNRVVSRSAKKVSNIVNGAKALAQTAKNVYNSNSTKVKKAKTTVSRTLSKYFG